MWGRNKKHHALKIEGRDSRSEATLICLKFTFLQPENASHPIDCKQPDRINIVKYFDVFKKHPKEAWRDHWNVISDCAIFLVMRSCLNSCKDVHRWTYTHPVWLRCWGTELLCEKKKKCQQTPLSKLIHEMDAMICDDLVKYPFLYISIGAKAVSPAPTSFQLSRGNAYQDWNTFTNVQYNALRAQKKSFKSFSEADCHVMQVKLRLAQRWGQNAKINERAAGGVGGGWREQMNFSFSVGKLTVPIMQWKSSGNAVWDDVTDGSSCSWVPFVKRCACLGFTFTAPAAMAGVQEPCCQCQNPTGRNTRGRESLTKWRHPVLSA